MDIKILDWLKQPENSKLLNENNFKALYAQFISTEPNTGKLTQILYDAGLDPLEYMDGVTVGMFRGVELDELIIPEHITRLSTLSFMDCSIRSLEVQCPISILPDKCFISSRIGYLYLPRSIIQINDSCFRDANIDYIGIDAYENPWMDRISIGGNNEAFELAELHFKDSK